MADLRKIYTELNKLSKIDLKNEAVTKAISNLAELSIDELSKYDKIDLKSTSIANKEYFIFDNNGKYSRPICKNLYLDKIPSQDIQNYISFNWDSISDEQINKLLYTIGISYCAGMDVLGGGDKKTPSVFFEIFIGNLFARELGVNPSNKVAVDTGSIKTSLPTDFLFEIEGTAIRIHLPIKLSTRERSIQAWAHQKVLEGVYGKGTFIGIMVILAETLFVKKDMAVVEVCLPDQWRLYQMYISEMKRVYFLDVPNGYSELPKIFPYIQIKTLANFIKEKNSLTPVVS